MASSREWVREVQEEARRAPTANLDFCPHKYSLLIIIGRTARPRRTEHVSGEIERGIRSWDVDLKSCNLNLYLQEFLSHHTVSFKGSGQKNLRHCTKVLDIQVLISPTQEQACSEVFALLSRESAHKLLILAGLTAEESGDLLFHKGRFSARQLTQILTEQLLDLESSGSSHLHSKISLTFSCPNVGQWKKTLLANPSLQGPITLRINPPEVLPAMESLQGFTSLISSTLCPASSFDLLPPPSSVGFLKLSRPCCYVFPAGCGDCAFFAINGFTVLVDGGSDSQACFWKLVRHLDRVDAVLLTHTGTENLPGVISFLQRKVGEKELTSELKDSSKKLISPELGVLFFNAPSRLQEEQQCVDDVLKSTQQAALTLQLLNKLDIKPQPMFRPQGVPIKPLTLFQKMGVGQLDLYILSPGKNSPEYETFMHSWPDGAPLKGQNLPLPVLASVTALLVWHPACPHEKVVRVLFPGVTPQEKLLQGLEKLKGLDFLQSPTVTTGDLERLGEDRKKQRTESVDSCKSKEKEGTNKQGKERGVREEGKDALLKEKAKTLNGSGSRDQTTKKETGLKHKASFSEKNSAKKGVDWKKEEKTGSREENNFLRKNQTKKDPVSSKPKNENKTKIKKETTNDSKTGEKRLRKSFGKELNESKKENRNSEMPNNSAKPTAVAKIPESENSELQKEKKVEKKQIGSKMSTPEDMTRDFLQLEEESKLKKAEASNGDRKRSSESEKEKSPKGLNREMCNETAGRSEEEAGALGVMAAEFPQKSKQQPTNEGVEINSQKNLFHEPESSRKQAKVVGFPSPFNKTPKTECIVEQDLTPTEYTLLDGALRNTPPSQSSPENQGPNSHEEQTVEQTSPDSRPNSAGHTPYCLSPDDVWCNRATQLSRLQDRMNDPDVADPVLCQKREEQLPQSPENPTKTKDKHLSFLPLGTFKEGSSDPSPSMATTTTTHSMPAEVSSPQSTEVDESLSMSFEQGASTVSQREGDDSVHHSNGGHLSGLSLPVKKPPRSLGQTPEMGRPPAPNTLLLEGSSHDVDLCLVSPCEFKHFKHPESGAGEASKGSPAPHQHSINNKSKKDNSQSESNAPVCTEDCPSTTADGALDSDEEESCSEASNSPHDLHNSQGLPADPLPAPLRDSPPLPPNPDASMPVPQSDLNVQGKKSKATGTRGKKLQGVIDGPQKLGSGKSRTVSGVTKGNASSARTAPAKASAGSASKPNSSGDVSVYVDLAYIPSGASAPTVTVDFFRCVRSSCYIVSGNSPEREELMRQTLDALLDGKSSWLDAVQVTLIPTFESASMQEWYQHTLDRQRELNVTVLGSNSTVAMQDETFPACKIEF
ncbi:microtubule-associated protein 1S isoform X2 [Oryzias latipes]